MYVYAGSVGESNYGTVSEGTSQTYSEASDWSYDGGNSGSNAYSTFSSDSHYGSYYEHVSATKHRSHTSSYRSSGEKEELPTLGECAVFGVILAIACCVMDCIGKI